MAETTSQNVPEVDLGDAVRSLSGGQFVFNRYSLVKLIGRGRTSAVWQAWDDQKNRDVALKFLPALLAQSAEALAEIRQAVARMGALELAQVNRVYGLETEDKLVAIAEELSEGNSLSALRAQRKNQVFDAVDLKEWLKQVLHTLEKLHDDAGIFHGSLKPGNIIITSVGNLVITDAAVDAKVGYWINKLEGSPRDVSQTARYASPEQGKGEPPGKLDDIYSLGVCIYELITSKPPFNNGNIVAQVQDDVPPSMTRRRRDMRILGEPIPRAWDETVAACLAKDPEKRPQTMADVADMLELYGPSKRAAAAAPNAAAMAAAAAAMAAAPSAPQPTPAAGIPGATPASGAKKNLVPLIAVGAGVVLGVAGWWFSTHTTPPDANIGFNKEGSNPPPVKAAGLSSEEIERQLDFERKAMQLKFEEEKKKIELESKRQAEELEKRKQALAQAAAAAKKAEEELLAKQKAAEEDARRRQAEADAKALKAAEDEKRLAAEREAVRKKEEELKAAQARSLDASAAADKAKAEAERKKIEQELAAQRAEAERIRAAAEESARKAAQEKADMEAATKKMAEEKAAMEAAAKKAAQEKAAMEAAAKKAADDALKAQKLIEEKNAAAAAVAAKAEADRQRKLEEARRREELERQIAMSKSGDEARRAEAARKAAEEKAKMERQAQLLAQANVVGLRPSESTVWHNSIGMRMVPVGALHVCAWETRVQDFEEFVYQSRFSGSTAWKNPTFKQGPTHPVVNVNYDDALAFCNWLTAKERKDGIIGSDQLYRLPTDAEWSHFAGLDNESGATPEERSGKNTVLYPWGQSWPPPVGAGNFSDSVTFDRFDNTAPVASFMPNQYGLYDVGGNAWEWCMDWGDGAQKQRVLRGGSFFGYVPGTMVTSYRLLLDGKERRYDNGFRVVLSK